MKLKTLKDIEFIQIPIGMDNCPSIVCGEYRLALRKEAIKCVKDFGNKYNNVARDILKHEWTNFFNITKEDLK